MIWGCKTVLFLPQYHNNFRCQLPCHMWEHSVKVSRRISRTLHRYQAIRTPHCRFPLFPTVTAPRALIILASGCCLQYLEGTIDAVRRQRLIAPKPRRDKSVAVVSVSRNSTSRHCCSGLRGLLGVGLLQSAPHPARVPLITTFLEPVVLTFWL